MTLYRLFPSTSGPASPSAFSGSFISAVSFTLSQGGCFFTGYFMWVCATGQATTPIKCALWSVTTNTPTGVLVPGSVVTSGTLTAGQWNFIPLATPIPLAPGLDPTTSTNGSAYVAAIGINGNFPDTNGFWGTGGPGINGIAQGPLFAYSGLASGGGTAPGPLSLPQGLFTTSESDPSAGLPGNGSNVDNFWVDVQISTTAPAGYTGTYRLWPNKYDANSSTVTDAAVNYTIATEIDLTAACTLNNVWCFSPSGATSLPTRADVWSIASGLPVASILSPVWLLPGGGAGSAGAGWVSAAFAGGTTLGAGKYRVGVFNANGTGGVWGARDAGTNYWGNGGSGGVGAAGIVSGPLSAPSQPSAQSGWLYNSGAPGATPPYSSGTAINAQPVFGQLPSGLVDFPQLYAPNTGTTTQNYWVDLEVTPLPVSAGGPVDMSYLEDWHHRIWRRRRMLGRMGL